MKMCNDDKAYERRIRIYVRWLLKDPPKANPPAGSRSYWWRKTWKIGFCERKREKTFTILKDSKGIGLHQPSFYVFEYEFLKEDTSGGLALFGTLFSMAAVIVSAASFWGQDDQHVWILTALVVLALLLVVSGLLILFLKLPHTLGKRFLIALAGQIHGQS